MSRVDSSQMPVQVDGRLGYVSWNSAAPIETIRVALDAISLGLSMVTHPSATAAGFMVDHLVNNHVKPRIYGANGMFHQEFARRSSMISSIALSACSLGALWADANGYSNGFGSFIAACYALRIWKPI